MEPGILTHETIKKLVGNKGLYIYAVNLEGVGYYRLFKRIGLDVKGFLDTRDYTDGKKMGKPIIHPDSFFKSERSTDSCVLIASKHRKFKKTAMEQCEKIGLVRNESYFLGMELCDYLPTVEVVGSCNLRCISCNMGLAETKPGGIMHPDAFRKVLEKMTSEIPFLNSLCLFLWGEPFLHPKLDEIIDITHEFGIACEISTNLNISKHIKKIIEAGPDVLAIPCSGIGRNYETTHTKGNWEVFRENLFALRKYIDEYKSDTSVKLYYHMYKHNLGEDYDTLKNIAHQLRYNFFPIIANIFPEKVYDLVINGTPLPPEMQRVSEMLLYPVEDQLKFAYEHRQSFCPFRKAFPTVRWNLSLVSCANMTKPSLHHNYLDVSLERLKEIRESQAHCKKCMENGIHRFFDVVNVTVDDVDGKRIIVREMK